MSRERKKNEEMAKWIKEIKGSKIVIGDFNARTDKEDRWDEEGKREFKKYRDSVRNRKKRQELIKWLEENEFSSID